jgi:hypothetical protein
LEKNLKIWENLGKMGKIWEKSAKFGKHTLKHREQKNNRGVDWV